MLKRIAWSQQCRVRVRVNTSAVYIILYGNIDDCMLNAQAYSVVTTAYTSAVVIT